MIYLASPYTADTREKEEKNYLSVLRFMGKIMTNRLTNNTVWSPIVHNHMFSVFYELPKDHLFWRERNHDFIRRCDELWIACIDGWEKSEGVLDEIKFARTCDIPVKYILEETL